MSYLDEILAQAQQGQAYDNLARTYGISPDQARQATEAMMPAFALGLQRSAQTPQNFAELLGAMSRNPYGDAFSNPGYGFGDVRAQGNDALAAMFGSPDVSRAVAVQAAATTGLSSALLKQMLPAIAAMVMGGLMKGGGQGAAAGGSGGGLGDLLGGMLGGGSAAAPQPRQAGAGSGNPLEDLLGGMLGGGGGGGQPRGGSGNPLQDILGGILGGGQPGGAQGGGNNPLQDILGGMLGGGAPQQRQRAPQEPDPSFEEETAPPPRQSGSGNPLEDLLGSILGGGAPQSQPRPRTDAGDGGQQPQDPRMQPFQDIFDQFFNGGRR